MVRTIKIRADRILDIIDEDSSALDVVGVVSEYNAEILHFIKPENINNTPIENFTMQILIQVGIDRYAINVVDDEFALDERFTGEEKIEIAIQFLQGDVVKWRSYMLPLYFADSVSDDNVHRNYLNYLRFTGDGEYLKIEWDGNIDIQVNGDYLEVTR